LADVDLAFGILIRLRAALVGISSSRYYKYLNTQHASIQLVIFMCTVWFHGEDHFKAMATAADSILDWHFAAVHIFRIYGFR
jgi:hypothetical protein